MSGRDVRRVAARASTSTHEQKLQQVTRLVLGALAQGVERIFLVDDPFRISRRAVENLPERDRVELIKVPPTHTARDTVAAADAMWEAGCQTFIALGGDGTNRIVAAARPDAALLPLSTGTNNVFPYMVEASVAGAAAGLVAAGKIDRSSLLRTKQVHVTAGADTASALVDAVVLRDDMLGSLLPFAPENLVLLVLARAEPASIGMSPIGGYLEPSYHEDDFGVLIETGLPAAHTVNAPVSAGLYGDVPVRTIRRLPLDEPVTLDVRGIVAFDGDRELIAEGSLEVVVRRDGPYLIDPRAVMSNAVRMGLLSR